MYLSIGGGYIVQVKDIIAICDLDNTTCSLRTREFLNAAEKRGEVVNAADDLPKSFVLCQRSDRQILYLSPFSPATLSKRM